MSSPEEETPNEIIPEIEALNILFQNLNVYENQKNALIKNLEHFRQLLEFRPVDSVEIYEKCILGCVRLGWDEEAFDCARRLADVIKSASRYKKLALAWRLKPRHDMCMLLLSRYLTDFFCDFPICATFFDTHRMLRFRYTMWDQGQIYVFGDNKNSLLGVKQKFIPDNEPVELKLPTVFQMAAMGSSQYHTIFQGINGEFYGCGAARNFMVNPKSQNEIFEEPAKIEVKFEPTDPVKNFYVSDHGTLIFTEKYLYLIGKQIDTKKKGKKWNSAFPETWFDKVGKGSQMSKNLMRFTINDEPLTHNCLQQRREEFAKTMPFNGSYMTMDNHAVVDFKGTPVKVFINEKMAYYRFENETGFKRIINYMMTGTEAKMGIGPDCIYPNGVCICMDPGQTLLMGKLQWAKKANCTDEKDVRQHTLLAYMDEVRGEFFMERFVATPGPRGFIYQVGRTEKRPFYTLKPAIRDAARCKMWPSYLETLKQCKHEKDVKVSYTEVLRLLDVIDAKITPEWAEDTITYDSRHIHFIGFLAFALSERTRLLKCHSKCYDVCWSHPLRYNPESIHDEFREVYTVPRLMDNDSDSCSASLFTSAEERMRERLRILMNHYDDHMHRFTPIWHSSETRMLVETTRMINELEIEFCRDREIPAHITYMEGRLIYKCIKRHIAFVRRQILWLKEHELIFREGERQTNIDTLYCLVCVALTWTVEYVVRGSLVGWSAPKKTKIYPHFRTRHPSKIVQKKVKAKLMHEDTVPIDVNIHFHYINKSAILRSSTLPEDSEAYLDIHTNKVLLAMINPKMVDHVVDGVLDVNEMLDSFASMWSVTLEYPLTVYFFLQHYRESPVTVNEREVPHQALEKLGFKLELTKHAANLRDCPDRMFGVTWHYATLKCNKVRSDQAIIAPGGASCEDNWTLKCRGGDVLCHRYLLQVYSRHPNFFNLDNKDKKDLEIDEEAGVVLVALRMLTDMSTMCKFDLPMQMAIARFYNTYLFPEALDDALAVLVLDMKQEDAAQIRELITEFPAIMERHIGVMRPTIVLTWKDDFLPEPKITHMARIMEHWPGKQYMDERITKTFLDPGFVRMLRTDEVWKRKFFTHPDDMEKPDLRQMIKEDMYTKNTFDMKAGADIDEV